MQEIQKVSCVQLEIERAFAAFVNDFGEWWPREYTWSGDALVNISLNGENGLCSETGPNHFRCDWATVSSLEPPFFIRLHWQISASRVPVPDLGKASTLEVIFTAAGMGETRVQLKHFNFEKHGAGYEDYRQAMNDKEGWDFILEQFRRYCDRLKTQDQQPV